MKRLARGVAFVTLAGSGVFGAPPTVWAQSEQSPGFVGRWWSQALEQASLGAPNPQPPLPVSVQWGKRKLGLLALSGAVLAVGAGDLNGDKSDELVILAEEEVVVAALRGDQFSVLSRAKLVGRRSAHRPRGRIGTLSFAGDSVRVRTAVLEKGIEFSMAEGQLVERGRFEGFPICGNAFVELRPGRDHFVQKSVRWGQGLSALWGKAWSYVPEHFWAAACVSDLLDSDGREMSVLAAVGVDGWLRVRCVDRSRCSAGPGTNSVIQNVGYAFAVADMNNDGLIEVATTGDTNPGQGDRVSIYARVDDRDARIVEETFAGGVIGLAAGDLDGNGALELVAVERLSSKNQVAIWVLNR